MRWTPTEVEASMAAVAAWGLPGAPQITVPDDPTDFEAFAASLQQTRLLGVLLAAAALGDVELPAELEEAVAARQEAALLWCICLEVRLLEVREWFETAGGVRHLVVKGPAIAHLDALEASVRTFADVDLLVAAADIDRAVAALAAHGAVRPWAQRRPGWDRRFAKSVTMTFPDGIELDVHRTLADGVFGHRIPLADLFVAPDRFQVGGVGFEALAAPHRLLHAAYHALLGSPTPALMNLRDLAAYLWNEALGPEAVLPEARRWGGEAVLAAAVDLVGERLGVVPPRWAEWRESYPADPSEVVMIDAHREDGSSLGRAKLDVLAEMRGVGSKASYLAALLWPSREHLRSRSLRRRDTFVSMRDVLRR